VAGPDAYPAPVTTYQLRATSPAKTRADAVVVGVLQDEKGPRVAPGGEDGFLGGDLEDAWMFACYYNEGESFEPGATNTTTTTTTKTPSPNTADTSDVTNMLFVALLAAGAVVITLSAKKATAR